ncbi:MAG: RebB like protein [Alphaproteobacteria bacterium]|nr:MAG: RebB like protein [Alphaproteobacteria bacterium]
MADNTPVNSQITDAVTQTNVKVVAEAPAQAMGLVYQTVAHSISLSMQNAMQAQGGLQQIGNAVTSSAVRMILEASGGGMGGGGGNK